LEKYQAKQLPSAIRIEAHYLPCLAYFTAIYPFDTVWLEAAEHYGKQSYRNRCYVRTANGVDRLTVPVLNGTHKQTIRDIKIDYRQSWAEQQWRCLEIAYRKAAFFEHYAENFRTVYQKKHTFLFDLNLEMLTICLHSLGWQKSINITKEFDKQPNKAEVADMHAWINPRGDDQSGRLYRPFPYLQNFGNDFVPNLSLIDLIFCQGPLASEILQSSLVQ
jgi:hypothetical protein